MKVLKFGGTSVGSPDRIRGVKRIIESLDSPCIIIVSAFSGVTDRLKQISEFASLRNSDYKTLLTELIEKHNETAIYLLHDERKELVLSAIAELAKELEETLHGVYLLRELSNRSLDHILSFGERLSSFIISHIMDDSVFVDTRYIIKTDDNYGNAAVNFDLTNILIRKELSDLAKIVVVPGFIGSNNQNETTTLGRGGSDYSAAIIAAALDASVLEIWTDVNGFMTADPKKVEKAYAIESLTYSEAIELSHFGAKVI